MTPDPGDAPRRSRRRAVGPRGAAPSEGPAWPELDEPAPEPGHRDDDRLLADRPPHHDRGV